MSGIDLVIPIGADQHEVLQIRKGRQVLNQVQGGCVGPLQIIEEQSGRPLRAGRARERERPPSAGPHELMVRAETADQRQSPLRQDGNQAAPIRGSRCCRCRNALTHLNLAGLSLFSFRQHDRDDAVLHLGADLALIDLV